MAMVAVDRLRLLQVQNLDLFLDLVEQDLALVMMQGTERENEIDSEEGEVPLMCFGPMCLEKGIGRGRAFERGNETRETIHDRPNGTDRSIEVGGVLPWITEEEVIGPWIVTAEDQG